MEIKIAGKYRLLKTIGQGGFGDVYKAQESSKGQQRAVKLERRSSGGDIIFYESRILQYLKDLIGIPRVYDVGFEGDYNYMAMDYCGYSLSSLQTLCGGKLSLKTVCLFGIHSLSILESVHNKYILHRDIKPENFLYDPETNHFYLIDFGLSKRYVDKLGKHIPRMENKQFRGTLRYCSLNMHLGIENTRRDDLECFCYMLIYFLKGKLPWQNIKAETESKLDTIKKLKMGIKISDLCEGIDDGFRELLTYARNLGFNEFPDYEKFRNIFRAILKKNGWK